MEFMDVVIPARNEARTIGPILETFRLCPNIKEIIVVIDPDTEDETANIANEYPYVHVAHSPNGGKGQCVAYGAKAIETERVILCDADYKGLTSRHIMRLSQPYDGMVIGVPDLPEGYPANRYWAWPWVSGFRCLPTAIVRSIDLHGYLMETQINTVCAKSLIALPLILLMKGLKSEYRMTPKRLQEMERDRYYGIENGILRPWIE